MIAKEVNARTKKSNAVHCPFFKPSAIIGVSPRAKTTETQRAEQNKVESEKISLAQLSTYPKQDCRDEKVSRLAGMSRREPFPQFYEGLDSNVSHLEA